MIFVVTKSSPNGESRPSALPSSSGAGRRSDRHLQDLSRNRDFSFAEAEAFKERCLTLHLSQYGRIKERQNHQTVAPDTEIWPPGGSPRGPSERDGAGPRCARKGRGQAGPGPAAVNPPQTAPPPPHRDPLPPPRGRGSARSEGRGRPRLPPHPRLPEQPPPPSSRTSRTARPPPSSLPSHVTRRAESSPLLLPSAGVTWWGPPLRLRPPTRRFGSCDARQRQDGGVP